MFLADISEWIVHKADRPISVDAARRAYVWWRLFRYESGLTILSPQFQALIDKLRSDYDLYDAQSVDGVIVAV